MSQPLQSTIYTGPLTTHKYSTRLDELRDIAYNVLFTDENWTPTDYKHPAIKLFLSERDGYDIPWIKVKTTMALPAEGLRRLLVNLKYRHEWDNKYEQSNYVEFYDPAQVLLHISFIAPWPVTSRDFLVISRTEMIAIPNTNNDTTTTKNNDNKDTILLISGSVEDERVPEQKGYVRAHAHCITYTITPNKDDENKCDVVYVISQDPKGSIPTFLVKSLHNTLPDMFSRLHELIEKKPTLLETIYLSFGEDFQHLLDEYAKQQAEKKDDDKNE